MGKRSSQLWARKIRPSIAGSHAAAREMLKPLAIVQTTESYCQLVNQKSHVVMPVTQTTYNVVTQYKFQWSIYLCVFLNRPGGAIEMEGEALRTNEYYRQSELSEFLNEQHKQLLDRFNPFIVTGMGWVAVARSVDPDDWDIPDTFKLFEDLGLISTERMELIDKPKTRKVT